MSTSSSYSIFTVSQAEAKERVLNDNNVNANVVTPREKETNQVEMSPKKRKVSVLCDIIIHEDILVSSLSHFVDSRIPPIC